MDMNDRCVAEEAHTVLDDVPTAIVPLSVMGSYMSITTDDEGTGVMLNSLHGNARFNQTSMRISFLLDGQVVRFHVAGRTAEALTLRFDADAESSVVIRFLSPRTLVIEGMATGMTVSLDLLPRYNYEFSQKLRSRAYGEYVIVNSAKNLSKYLVFGVNCALGLDQSIDYDPAGGDGVAGNRSVVTAVPGDWMPSIVIREIFHFMETPDPHRLTEMPEGFMPFTDFVCPYLDLANGSERLDVVRLAAMILWSNIVQPLDQLKSWTLYASNKRFAGMWSWDHAFGSLALGTVHPNLATEVMRSIYTAQAPNGQIPDMLTDSTINWNFSKPPVQPMLFAEMCARGHPLPDQSLLESFRRHVDFYLRDMRSDDGLCIYLHGNDSGEDNSTLFAGREAVASPDLNAIVIRDCLSLKQWLAETDPAGSEHYGRVAQDMLGVFQRFFDDDGDVHAIDLRDGSPIGSGSIMPELAVIIGDSLPIRERTRLVRRLVSPQRLTRFGLASERVDSPWYTPDGYWRGPVWAPTTVLCYLALVRLGERELARDVARRFCGLIEREGLFENYDALTGRGLRDSGFMWSAAAYLFLLGELRDR